MSSESVERKESGVNVSGSVHAKPLQCECCRKGSAPDNPVLCCVGPNERDLALAHHECWRRYNWLEPASHIDRLSEVVADVEAGALAIRLNATQRQKLARRAEKYLGRCVEFPYDAYGQKMRRMFAREAMERKRNVG